MKKRFDKAAICKAVGTILGLLIVFISNKEVNFDSIFGLNIISTFAILGYLAGNIFYAFINIVSEATKDV